MPWVLRLPSLLSLLSPEEILCGLAAYGSNLAWNARDVHLALRRTDRERHGRNERATFFVVLQQVIQKSGESDIWSRHTSRPSSSALGKIVIPTSPSPKQAMHAAAKG
ncbi:hypothetical protein LX36DRAFT_662229 [Colletotrichum falcatum]|nr:hypothetical protein LX36DRAFT_662229 [Colletotrichum falcatum]